MAERIIALTEGNLDRVVVEWMLRDQDAEVYPKKEARARGGKATAIADAVVRLRNGTVRLVLALDLNGGDELQLISQVERELRDIRRDSGRTNVFLSGAGASVARVCVWPVGLRQDPALQALGIVSHSVEDLILKALQVPECLANVERSEPGVRVPPEPWSILSEMLRVAREKGAQVNTSKDVLRVFLALISFGPSLATVGERVIRCADGTAAQAFFERPQEFTLP